MTISSISAFSVSFDTNAKLLTGLSFLFTASSPGFSLIKDGPKLPSSPRGNGQFEEPY